MKNAELHREWLRKGVLPIALVLGSLAFSAQAATPAPAAPGADTATACNGKKEGDKVTVALPGGKTANAVCRKVKGKLVAQRTASIGP